MRVAIVCPGQFGDVCESTAILAYREELWGPDPHIDWFIGSKCATVLDHNPYVTPRIYDLEGPDLVNRIRRDILIDAYERVYWTAPYFHMEYVFRMPLPLIPALVVGLKRQKRGWKPLVFLSDQEREHAREFVESLPRRPKIMLETVGFSFQSAWDIEFTKRLVERLKDHRVLYLTASFGAAEEMRAVGIENVVGLDDIPFRELMEVYNHCDLFFSSASGVASLTAAEGCKRLPRVEYIVKEKCPGWGTDAISTTFAHYDPEIVLDKMASLADTLFQRDGKERRKDRRRARRRAARTLGAIESRAGTGG